MTSLAIWSSGRQMMLKCAGIATVAREILVNAIEVMGDNLDIFVIYSVIFLHDSEKAVI